MRTTASYSKGPSKWTRNRCMTYNDLGMNANMNMDMNV